MEKRYLAISEDKKRYVDRDLENDVREILEGTISQPGDLHYVGGEDEDGLVQVPLIGFTPQGIAGDWTNISPNIWIQEGRPLGEGDDLFDLFARAGTDDAGEQQPAKAGQNSIVLHYAFRLQDVLHCPAYITGSGFVKVFTVGRYCRVEIRTYSGRTIYAENMNVVNPDVPWSAWKPEVYSDEELNIGSILKATGEQSIGNSGAKEDTEGNWMVGSLYPLGAAKLTVAGRLSVFRALFSENAVPLGQLNELLFGKVDVTLFDATVLALQQTIQGLSNTAHTHTHTISQIIDLFDQLQSKVPKSLANEATDTEYDAITAFQGQFQMKSVKNPYIKRSRLPDAQQGVAYDFTLPGSDIVFPTKTNRKNVSFSSNKNWLTITYTGGNLRFQGTPGDSEDGIVTVVLDTDTQTVNWILLLAVLPVGATVVAPADPSGLVLSEVTQTSMRATWIDNSNNEEGFQLQIATIDADGNYVNVITTGPNVTTQLITGLAPATRYYVRNRAVNTGFFSEWVAADITTLPAESGGNLFEEYPDTARLYDFSAVVITPDPDPPIDPDTQIPDYGKNIRRINWQTTRSVEYDEFRWSDGKVYSGGQAPAGLTVIAGDVRKGEKDTWDEVIEHTRQQILTYKTPFTLLVVMTWGDFQFSSTNIDFRPWKYLMDRCYEKGVKLEPYFDPCFDKNIVTGLWDSSRDGWAYRESDLMMVKQADGNVVSAHGGGFSMSSDYAKTNALNTFQAIINFTKSQASASAVREWGWCISAEKESHAPIPTPGAQNSVADFNPASIESFKEWLLVNYGNGTAYGNVSSITAGSIQPFYAGSGSDQEKYLLWLKFMTGKIWGFHQQWMQIARNAGYDTVLDFGSFIDELNARLHKLFLGYGDGYNTYTTTMKHNPALQRGLRDGSGNYGNDGNAWYEAAVLVGTGKKAMVEWTFDQPSMNTYLGGDMGAIISNYTRIYKETFDAGASGISIAFVSKISDFNTYAKPVLDNLKADGYFGKAATIPTPVPGAVTTVSLAQAARNLSHYAAGYAANFRDKVVANGIQNCAVRIVSDEFLP